MKLYIGSGLALAAFLAASPALAQSAGSAPWIGHDLFDPAIPLGSDAASETRMSGKTHAQMVDDMVAQDRKAIKDLKLLAKSPEATDDDRTAIKAKIKELESDIIALQQQ